jgi:hypothetical protein
MTRRVVLLFTLLVAPLLPAQTLEELMTQDHVRVTAELKPAGTGVIATQRVNLLITLATDTWFAGGTRITPPDIRNAIVLQRQAFGVNSTQREQGRTWATQTWTIEIYPQYPGDYAVPPVAVDLTVADGRGGLVNGTTLTPSLAISAREPPVAPPAPDWVVASSLNVDARWDRSLDELQAGDSRRRTIRIRAENLPAMVLPLPGREDLAGLGIYPQPVRREDKTNRGQAEATVEYAVDYFCEEPGDYTVPGWELAWWQPDEQRWQVARVPAASFTVSPDPNAPALQETDPADEPGARRLGKRLLLLLAGATIVYALLRWLGPPLTRAGRALWHRISASPPPEIQAWRKLQSSLRHDDPFPIITQLYAWLDHLPANRRCATLTEFARRSGDARLPGLVDELLTCSYGGSSCAYTSHQELRQSLRQLRRHQPKALMKHTFDKIDLDPTSGHGPTLNFPA